MGITISSMHLGLTRKPSIATLGPSLVSAEWDLSDEALTLTWSEAINIGDGAYTDTRIRFNNSLIVGFSNSEQLSPTLHVLTPDNDATEDVGSNMITIGPITATKITSDPAGIPIQQITNGSLSVVA